jgi:DnaK suppressor protein
MLNMQKEYFEKLLSQNLSELLMRTGQAISGSTQSEERYPDFVDLALFESNAGLSFRISERQSRLIRKIAVALEKLRTGEYGICEECGAEISKERLMVRPVASLCIDCKRAEEKAERIRG